MHRSPAVSGPVIFGWTLLFVAALVRAPAEFGHYRLWLELAPEETLLRVAVGTTLLGSALFVVAIGGILPTLLARRAAPRTLHLLRVRDKERARIRVGASSKASCTSASPCRCASTRQ